jgi:hypothetical protein
MQDLDSRTPLLRKRRNDEIGFVALSDAQRSPAKLNIPKWGDAINPATGERGEVLRAPFPIQSYGWM